MDASEYRERAGHVKACLRVLLTHEMTLPTLLRCWLGFYEASVRSAQSPVADAQWRHRAILVSRELKWSATITRWQRLMRFLSYHTQLETATHDHFLTKNARGSVL
jgi:hypothetical protein